MAFVSYAQNSEDVLLNRVFGGKRFGFYVDVGACHPIDGSVTKTFYDRGWCGINVEPGEIFDVLTAARPRDVNLRIAVLDRTGEASFLENNDDHGLSRVIDGADSQASGTVRVVPCDTLSNIIAAHGQCRPVDFVKIDVEGAEAAIIGSTDWRALRPTLLVVESTLPWTSQLTNQDWEPALVAQGYRRVYFDGVNCFYAPEELAEVAAQFATPVNVLDGFVRFDPDRENLVARVLEAEAGLERLVADYAVLTEQRTEAQNRLSQLKIDYDRLATHAAELCAALETTTADCNELRHQAAVLNRLVRELRWPAGPRALRVTLPVSRLVRRLRRTRVPDGGRTKSG